jgi:hypothetical protein
LKKHIPLKRTLIIFPIIFFSLNSFSQQTDTLLARLITNLRTCYEMNPDEKCYAHLDKSFYQPGETVFLKAYLTLNNGFSTLSNIVYTDMSDAGGRLLHKAMWKAENGTANASIFLPDTLSTGLYRIRCYSLWMLNQPHAINEQYIFVQGRKDQSKSYITAPGALQAIFFPEGGQLIQNVVNRVAFRVHDAHQLPPVGIKAVLTDEAGSTIAEPLVFENGIGLVEFTPLAGKKYRLQITSGKNAGQQFSVPPASSIGINLKAENLSPTKVFIQANATDQFIDQYKTVYMLAQQNGKTVALQQLNLAEMQNATVINKKNLQQGMMQVTLFSEQLQPLAERWIWVQLPSTGSLELNTSALSFAPKSKNTFSISFSGVDTPQLSVSVVPADLPTYSFINTPDIQTYGMLHSNDTGPHFVLPSLQKIKAEDYSKFLDAVTLTMQPSRFNWLQIRKGTLEPLTYFFETGISLRGMVKKDKERMDFDSSKIDLITKAADSSTIFSASRIDERGAFAVNDLHFSKFASVSGLATTKEKKRRKVEFDLLPSYIDTLQGPLSKPNYQPVYAVNTAPKSINETFVKYYSVADIGKELQEIVVKGKTKQERYIDSLNKALSSESFRTSEFTKVPDSNFTYTSFAQLFEQEFFGFRFNTGYDRVAGMDGSASTGMASADVISYYLNEVPIDATELNFINPADVVLIKVNRNANLHLGVMGPGPSVLIYTKNKRGSGRFGLSTSYITGYSIPLSFRSPEYSSTDTIKSEDRRTTLLWQPQVQFAADGKAVIHFFNNSYTTKYKIIIQGIDKKGNIYFIEKTVE